MSDMENIYIIKNGCDWFMLKDKESILATPTGWLYKAIFQSSVNSENIVFVPDPSHMMIWNHISENWDYKKKYSKVIHNDFSVNYLDLIIGGEIEKYYIIRCT